MDNILVEYVKNPKWDNIEHSSLTATVKFSHFDSEVQFTASPDDSESYGRKIWVDCISGVYGDIADATTESVDEIIEQYKQVIQDKLDNEARKLEYDNADRVIARQNSTNPKYRAEGIAFNKWYDELWGFGTDLLNKVLAGEAEIPTLEEFEAMLPPLVIEYPEGIDY